MVEMFKYKKIFVLAPGGFTTGGPELLHQLVNELRKIGVNAFISYYPFDQKFEIPSVYKKYDAPQLNIEDINNNLVIFPEVATGLIRSFKNVHKAVWWLSVDNYFGGENNLNNKIKHIVNIAMGRKLRISAMRNFEHYSQSHYAQSFLCKNGIKSYILSDYINEKFLTLNDYNFKDKKNIILYNPKKGMSITKKLIDLFPEYDFVPLINLSPEQVVDKLKTAKLYIDFGNHPGKDRFPREAVMCGCCLITGVRGSSCNSIDVPISQKFKLNENDGDFEKKFSEKVDEIFSNYEEVSKEFDDYRAKIKNEKNVFIEQVKQIFSRN